VEGEQGQQALVSSHHEALEKYQSETELLAKHHDQEKQVRWGNVALGSNAKVGYHRAT